MTLLKEIKIGVKYCGGCNPRYDRVEAVERLKAAFPGVSFVTSQECGTVELLVAVCGCSARCVSVSEFQAVEEKICWFVGEEDFPALCRVIGRLVQQDGRESSAEII